MPRCITLSTILAFSLCALPADAGQGASKAEVKAFEKQLKGRGVTAKIDLPLRKGMVVFPDGTIDFASYRAQLADLPPSIRRYERARLNGIRVEKKTLQVILNYGGWGGMKHRGHLKWLQPGQENQQGTTINIVFSRPVRAADLKPEVLRTALRDVVDIDSLTADVGQTAAPPAPPAAAPVRAASSVTLLAVEAIPSRVRRGEEVELTLRFEVTGASAQHPVAVVESRQVYFGETGLFAEPRTQEKSWPAGTHSSIFRLTVPATTQIGVYRFQGTIIHRGTSQSREALFEVLGGT